MEGMIVTESPPTRATTAERLLERLSQPEPWTFDDLSLLWGALPEGQRYEIIDGSLLVSPAPKVPHCRVATLLDRVFARQAPPQLETSAAGFAIRIKGYRSYLIPDVIVMNRSAFQSSGDILRTSDVLLVVEVLSPSNRDSDLVSKRFEYAAGRIPQYWIVDPEEETMTVLALADGETYVEKAVVRPGTPWKTDEPFPLTLDVAEIF
jgi:Uma2 family endonuclease